MSKLKATLLARDQSDVVAFNPSGGKITEAGKWLYQDGKIIGKYDSSTLAKSTRDGYNERLMRAESQEDTEHLLAAMAEYGMAQAQANYEFGQKAAEENLKRYPRIAEAAKKATEESGSFLNEAMQKAYEDMLDKLHPTWREDIIDPAVKGHLTVTEIADRFNTEVLPKAMDAVDEMSEQMLGIVNAQLRGELNLDVAASLKRTAAEVSQQIGVRGQAAQYLTARDLGKTSMELQEKGLANAGTAAQFQSGMYGLLGNTAQMAVQSGANLTNLLSAYRSPIADMQALYAAQLGGVTQAGMIPASTVMQTGAQVQTNALGQARNATESMYGYNAQLTMNQQAMDLQQQMLAAQKKQNRWDNALGVVKSISELGNTAAKMYGAGMF